MDGAAEHEDLKSTTYELFILAISILSIVNLVLEFATTSPSRGGWSSASTSRSH